MSKLFVTGTDTDVGKTVVMTLLTEALAEVIGPVFPYKPIETGTAEEYGPTDVDTYRLVIEQAPYPHRTYSFSEPHSPHYAARIDHTPICIDKIEEDLARLEAEYREVLIEGAGGLFVPLRDEGGYIIDLIQTLEAGVVLVASSKLGTINHTLLSVHALRDYGIPIIGIMFTYYNHKNPQEQDNIRFIEQATGLPILGTVPYREDILEILQTASGRKQLRQDWKIEECVSFLRRNEDGAKRVIRNK